MNPTLAALRRFPVIRLLSSIRFGVGLMVLILVYACLASALPQVRGALEMTEMQIFRHWTFSGMIVLFGLSVMVATLTRIKMSWINAGVLTVHTGLMMLVVGSIVYFATKIEGDTLLISPKVQLVSVSGGSQRVIAEVLAEKGQSWTNQMPAFGGRVELSVLDVSYGEDGLIRSARVAAAIAGETRELAVDRGSDAELAPGRLLVRLDPSRTVETFYDNETAALYVRRGGGAETAMIPIEGLPYFRERYLPEQGVIKDATGKPAASKRSRPGIDVAGRTVSTKLLEDWRLPIELTSEAIPFDITVTGYLPYIAGMISTPVEGGGALNPVVQVGLSVGTTSIDESLVALDPAHSMMPRGIPIEFRWFESEAEMQEALRPMASAHELQIEVKDPPLSKTVAVVAGQTIKLEGTSYELTVKDLQANWPMMTPGYEGASSPMASVDVKSEGKRYNRTVIQRFGSLSQDIDEQGVRHREGPYDPNLVLQYRTSEDGWVTIAAGPGIAPRLAVFGADGSVDVKPVTLGEPRAVTIMSTPLDLTVRSFVQNSEMVLTPLVEPLERRRPNIAARSASAIRLVLTPRGGEDRTPRTQWVAFSQYPYTEARPIRVRLPGMTDEYEIIYSRLERSLNATLIPRKLSVKFFPGRQNVESWRSDFLVQAGPGAAPSPAAVYTNQTCTAGGWTLFQSGAAGDHWSYTVLGVGNRKGIWTMVLGCLLVTLGSLYAFYVKPVLLKRRAAAGRASAGTSRAPVARGSSPDDDADGGYQDQTSHEDEPAEVRA